MKKLLPVSILILFSSVNIALAQDEVHSFETKASQKDTKIVAITSLNGPIGKVKIIPDYANRVLLVSSLTDKIAITDFWGVPPEIKILNKNFIEIKYALRGGSGVGLGNILILCVYNNKLYEAMHVLRYISGESGDEQDYHIKFTLSGNQQSNYRLTANIHDEVNSIEPQIAYKYDSQTVLHFDRTLHVFYSIKDDLYNYKFITKLGKLTVQKKGGVYPAIILGKNIYYFIDGKWYEAGKSNTITEV